MAGWTMDIMMVVIMMKMMMMMVMILGNNKPLDLQSVICGAISNPHVLT